MKAKQRILGAGGEEMKGEISSTLLQHLYKCN